MSAVNGLREVDAIERRFGMNIAVLMGKILTRIKGEKGVS